MVATLAFPKSRRVVIGFVRGEPFVDFLPLNYWIASLDSPDVEGREEAAVGLGNLGAKAQSAVPRMLRMFSDFDGRFGAVIGDRNDARFALSDGLKGILRGMGDPARQYVPDLVRLLESSDQTTRHYILEVLERIGPPARDALPAVRQRLRDEWSFVRSSAVAAMLRIDPDATIQTLIETLNDGSSGIRRDAAERLGRLGAKATQALPVLQKLLD